MTNDASRDSNEIPTLLGVSNADGRTPVKIWASPSTHRLLVDSSGGGGGTPGSPVNSIQYNNAGSFGGSSTLLFDGSGQITFGTEDSTSVVIAPDATTSNTDGGTLEIRGGGGNGNQQGGESRLIGGTGGATAAGGNAEVVGGDGGGTSGAGGNALIQGGGAIGTNSNGGDVILEAGLKTGAGTDGNVKVEDPNSALFAIFSTTAIASTSKTFTFPNASGTFQLSGGSGTGQFADNETPSGTINSSNVTFTLAHTPAPAGSLQLFLNGALQQAGGGDYSLSTATITFNSALLTGSILIAWYRW